MGCYLRLPPALLATSPLAPTPQGVGAPKGSKAWGGRRAGRSQMCRMPRTLTSFINPDPLTTELGVNASRFCEVVKVRRCRGPFGILWRLDYHRWLRTDHKGYEMWEGNDD